MNKREHFTMKQYDLKSQNHIIMHKTAEYLKN